MSWLDGAACKGKPTGWWFAEGQTVEANILRRKAKAVCQTCPVVDDCATYALSHPARDLPGVWGGMSQRHRRHIQDGTPGRTCKHCDKPHDRAGHQYCTPECAADARRAAIRRRDAERRDRWKKTAAS